jgi:multiple sugar transport system permease protein
MSAKRWKRILLGVVSWMSGLLLLFPILWWFLSSLKPFGAIFHKPPVFVFRPTFDWYRVVLGGVPYTETELAKTQAITGEGGGSYYALPAIRDSVLVAIGTVALTLLALPPGAYALSRWQTRRRQDLMMWILSTRMLPPVTVVIPFYLMYRRMGLLDSYLGLILAHTAMSAPLVSLLLKSFFDEIPREVEEAALIDGATRWITFQRILLPIAQPGLAAAVILTFIVSWDEFLFSLVLTSVNVRTMPVLASTFVTAYGTEWGFLAALGSAAMVPAFCFLFLVQRHIVRGLTLGAVH